MMNADTRAGTQANLSQVVHEFVMVMPISLASRRHKRLLAAPVANIADVLALTCRMVMVRKAPSLVRDEVWGSDPFLSARELTSGRKIPPERAPWGWGGREKGHEIGAI